MKNCLRVMIGPLLLAVVSGCFFAQANADDRLSLKVEMRHGPSGPKHAATAVPGEYVYAHVSLRGKAIEAAEELQFEIQAEVRSESGELITTLIPKSKRNVVKTPGSVQFSSFGGFYVPKDVEGESIKHVLTIRELSSGIELVDELSVKIHRPKGPCPFNVVYFALEPTGAYDASGRFTVGQQVRLNFFVRPPSQSRILQCKLEHIPKNEVNAVRKMDWEFEIAKDDRSKDKIPVKCDFAADEVFEGKIRLTVTDEAKNSHSVELPLVVNEALELDKDAFLAEKPTKSGEETKKE